MALTKPLVLTSMEILMTFLKIQFIVMVRLKFLTFLGILKECVTILRSIILKALFFGKMMNLNVRSNVVILVLSGTRKEIDIYGKVIDIKLPESEDKV